MNMRNNVNALTIVTVAGPGDEQLVRENVEYISRKNPGCDYIVHILDNGCFHGHPNVSIDKPNVTVHKGQAPDPSKPNACRGSYQHSAALNYFLRNNVIETPYLLVLDPDYYILRSDWISEVLDFMTTGGLTFFGAPWHPKWYSKHRYFPCVHCMFIDVRQVDCAALDFTPDLVERGAKVDKRNGLIVPASKSIANAIGDQVVPRNWFPVFIEIARDSLKELCQAYIDNKQPIPRSLKYFIRLARLTNALKNKARVARGLLASMTVNRRTIGAAHDTGYLVEKAYAGKNWKVDTLIPSVILARDFSKPHLLSTRIGRFVDTLFPDKWSYIPKRRGYYTENGFNKMGYPDAALLGWEEFFWLGVPFGVHMRRYNKKTRDLQAETKLLSEFLGR